MNYYLSKYVGTYRVKAAVDYITHDFMRDRNGNLENDCDIWIQCYHDIRIYYYGNGVLEVWIPSIRRGNNIISDELIKKYGYDFEVTDAEVIFKIKDKDLHNIIDILNPITSGAGISPFSPKNLKTDKNKVQLTDAQIALYQSITNKVPKEDKLVISKLNAQFVSDVLLKKLKKSLGFKTTADIKTDMKKEQLKLREYIYYRGYEGDYIDYLKKEIDKIYGNNKD